MRACGGRHLDVCQHVIDTTACRFVFCRWLGMIPLRPIPTPEWAISTWLQRYSAGADNNALGKEMRAGLAFVEIAGAHVRGQMHNAVELSITGQWSPASKTAETTYLNQGYYVAVMAHKVCHTHPCI